ncbi:nuclease [Candidatus Geothermarchaeota archaeon ex4572_27]|nr:MAG: nuclease [Candidatus Geothermarchaeota archaeon ex4572_27]
MLPSSLLRVKVRGRWVKPAFSHLTDLELYVADWLIEVFESSVGSRLRELEARLEEVEAKAVDYGVHFKEVRGLVHLLRRRASFARPKVRVDPIRARLEVFRQGPALTPEERAEALRRAASRLGVGVEEVERSFEAAYEEEMVLERFSPPTAEELLRQYNLALLQTLCFKAVSMEAWVRGSGGAVKRLLRAAKRLGLMYVAEQAGGGVRLAIDGPASAVRHVERYGTRLAKLIPLIVAAEDWRLKVRVSRGGSTKLMLLDSSCSRLLPPKPVEEVEFDSQVEEDFYTRFNAARLGWEAVREPEPLVVDGVVMIPDFALVRGDTKVYLEIVGFWTPSYLKRKLEKLRRLRGVDVIVAVDEELACSELEELPFDVVLYRRRLDIGEVYRRLKRYEAPQAEPSEERVEELKLPEEAAKYLAGVERERLSVVIRRLIQLGVPRDQVYRAIQEAGLKVRWRTLTEGEVVREG